jgi:hypothetical protein
MNNPRYELFGSTMITLSIVMALTGLWAGGTIASADPSITPGTACPLSFGKYSVSLDSTEIEGKVGRPVLIRLKLSPYPAPSGFFYSTMADVLKRPEGPEPEILPGDREIQIRCLTPGDYRLLIKVNLIAKSSCGGAKARILKEQQVVLHIL